MAKKTYNPFNSEDGFGFRLFVFVAVVAGLIFYKYCGDHQCPRLEIRLVNDKPKATASHTTPTVEGPVVHGLDIHGGDFEPTEPIDEPFLKQPSGPIRKGPTTLERLRLADAIQQSTKNTTQRPQTENYDGEEASLAFWDGRCRTAYEEGSVKYRECRARLANVLHQRCSSANWDAQKLKASDGLKEYAHNICYADRHFKIID